MIRKAIVLMAALALVLGMFALAGAERSGEEVYNSKCKMCHDTGLSGAPKPGDKAEWDKRKTMHGGLDELVQSAIKGKNAMPPKGACTDCSDAEIKTAVEFMVK